MQVSRILKLNDFNTINTDLHTAVSENVQTITPDNHHTGGSDTDLAYCSHKE